MLRKLSGNLYIAFSSKRFRVDEDTIREIAYVATALEVCSRQAESRVDRVVCAIRRSILDSVGRALQRNPGEYMDFKREPHGATYYGFT